MVSVAEDEAGTYSIDEAIRLTGHGRYNYQLLIVCSLISHAVALDMFGFNVVVAAASCDLRLGLTESGALASAPFAGLIFAYPWGYYADTKGRRRALLLSTSVGFIMASLTSFAPSWQIMLALKIIGCAFSTASLSLTMTYLGECTGPELRDRYLFIMTSANLASDIVCFGLAYFLLPLDFNLPMNWLSITFRPWRLYTLIMACTLGLGALMMYFLKESPKFLADRGNIKKSIDALKFIYETNGGKNDYPVKCIKIERKEEQEEGFCSSVLAQTIPLFKPPLLWTTLQLFYLFTVVCGPNNVLILWFSMIVNMFFKSLEGSNVAGESFCERIASNLNATTVDSSQCDDVISPNTLFSGIIFGVFYAVMILVVSRVATWRKVLLITSFTVAAICCVIVDLLSAPLAIMLAFMLMHGTILGLGSVASFIVDFYPTVYRGMAMSLGMMTARLVALAGTNVVGLAIVNYCTITFYALAIFIAGGVLVVFFLPAAKVT